MQTTGIVTHRDEKFIEVTYIRNSACSNCHSKKACLDSLEKKEIIKIPVISLITPSIFSEGDTVRVTALFNRSFYFVLTLVYIIPLIFMLIFVLILNYAGKSELVQFGGAIAGLFTGLVPAYITDKHCLKNKTINYLIEK